MTLDVRDTSFVANTAEAGGAVFLGADNDATFDNVAFISNTATSGNAGALYLLVNFNDSNGDFRHVSFYDNSATLGGNGIYAPNPTNMALANAVFWGQQGDDVNGIDNIDISYTCSEQFLGVGPGNSILLASPYDLGMNGELFLNQVQQDGCVDGGSDAIATTSFAAWGADWQDMTTAEAGDLDVPTADVGVHYLP